MAALKNDRHERFAQAYARLGKGAAAALEAGYGSNLQSASVSAARLNKQPEIRARIAELMKRDQTVTAEKAQANKAWVLKQLIANAEEARAAKDRQAANRALELVGKELGMFVDRKLVMTSPLEALSAAQLQALVVLAEGVEAGTIEASPIAAAHLPSVRGSIEIVEEIVDARLVDGVFVPEDAPADDLAGAQGGSLAGGLGGSLAGGLGGRGPQGAAAGGAGGAGAGPALSAPSPRSTKQPKPAKNSVRPGSP